VLDAGTAIGNNTYIKLESKVNIMIKLATLKMTLATTFIYGLAVRVLDAGTAIGNNMAININFIDMYINFKMNMTSPFKLMFGGILIVT
jgi:hypothetical protein